MKSLLVIIVLHLAVCVLLSNGALSANSLRREMVILRGNIDIIYDMLATECPSHSHHFKRQEINGNLDIQLDVQRRYYAKLVEELAECRKSNTALPSQPTASIVTKASTTAEAVTATKSTIKPTTSPVTQLTSKKKTPVTPPTNPKNVPRIPPIGPNSIVRNVKLFLCRKHKIC